MAKASDFDRSDDPGFEGVPSGSSSPSTTDSSNDNTRAELIKAREFFKKISTPPTEGFIPIPPAIVAEEKVIAPPVIPAPPTSRFARTPQEQARARALQQLQQQTERSEQAVKKAIPLVIAPAGAGFVTTKALGQVPKVLSPRGGRIFRKVSGVTLATAGGAFGGAIVSDVSRKRFKEAGEKAISGTSFLVGSKLAGGAIVARKGAGVLTRTLEPFKSEGRDTPLSLQPIKTIFKGPRRVKLEDIKLPKSRAETREITTKTGQKLIQKTKKKTKKITKQKVKPLIRRPDFAELKLGPAERVKVEVVESESMFTPLGMSPRLRSELFVPRRIQRGIVKEITRGKTSRVKTLPPLLRQITKKEQIQKLKDVQMLEQLSLTKQLQVQKQAKTQKQVQQQISTQLITPSQKQRVSQIQKVSLFEPLKTRKVVKPPIKPSPLLIKIPTTRKSFSLFDEPKKKRKKKTKFAPSLLGLELGIKEKGDVEKRVFTGLGVRGLKKGDKL